MENQKLAKITFANISKEECLTIYPRIFENGESLLNMSNMCSDQNNFGLALSLSILGAEEYLKGIVIYLNGTGVNVFKHKELARVMVNHKNRHEMASLIELMRLVEAIVGSGFLNETRESLKSDQGFLGFMKKAVVVLKSTHSMHTNVAWWEKANELKNRGLYVGYDNQLLLPKEITENQYKESRVIIDDMVKSCRTMVVTFGRITKDQLESTINDLNKAILLSQKD